MTLMSSAIMLTHADHVPRSLARLNDTIDRSGSSPIVESEPMEQRRTIEERHQYQATRLARTRATGGHKSVILPRIQPPTAAASPMGQYFSNTNRAHFGTICTWLAWTAVIILGPCLFGFGQCRVSHQCHAGESLVSQEEDHKERSLYTGRGGACDQRGRERKLFTAEICFLCLVVLAQGCSLSRPLNGHLHIMGAARCQRPQDAGTTSGPS